MAICSGMLRSDATTGARTPRSISPAATCSAFTRSVCEAKLWVFSARHSSHGIWNAALLVAYVDDLVALEAARGLHFDHLARLLADQGTGNGRADVDTAGLDVGLILADDLPGE